MDEQLIPQVIVDLVQKYMLAETPDEQMHLRQRLNDIMEFTSDALKTKALVKHGPRRYKL